MDFLAIDWENCFHNLKPEKKVEIFIKTVNDTILNHAPIKKLNGRNQPAKISLGLLEELKKLLITKTSFINYSSTANQTEPKLRENSNIKLIVTSSLLS